MGPKNGAKIIPCIRYRPRLFIWGGETDRDRETEEHRERHRDREGTGRQKQTQRIEVGGK